MADIKHIARKTDRHWMFETDLKWLRDTHSVMTASTVIDPIHVATAGVFGGELESWSPEQLFLAAINSSFLSSFLAFANKYDCEIISYKCNCIGEIKRRENHFGFTKINLFPTIMVSTENQRTRAKIALEESQQSSIIVQSINAEIIYHPAVTIHSNCP